MADADELLRAGDLQGARAALIETVKRAPTDQPARLYLFQLLCLQGEWDRAQTHLRTLSSLSPEAQMLAVNYNMAIDAERNRAEVFAGSAQPSLLVGSSTWGGDLAASIGLLAKGKVDEALARREQAFDAAPDTPGSLGEQSFDWISDSDPRFGPSLEAIIAGRWGLAPFDAIERIESEGPKDLRDLVWLPAVIAFKTGQSVNALLPVRYPGTESSDDDTLKLARATIWNDAPGGPCGLGQHEWTLSDGSEVSLLALRNLTFDGAA